LASRLAARWAIRPAFEDLSYLAVCTAFYGGCLYVSRSLGAHPVIYSEDPVPLARFTVQLSQSSRKPGEPGGRIQVIETGCEVRTRSSGRVCG